MIYSAYTIQVMDSAFAINFMMQNMPRSSFDAMLTSLPSVELHCVAFLPLFLTMNAKATV